MTGIVRPKKFLVYFVKKQTQALSLITTNYLIGKLKKIDSEKVEQVRFIEFVDHRELGWV